jgi:hypothetical protein
MIATLALFACSFSLPKRLDDGDPTAGCRADGIDEAMLASDVEWLARSPRRTEARREEVRTWLTERLTALGFTVEAQRFTISQVTGTNLVATGSAGGDVWVGAHYDSVGDTPGADDNATGVAGTLELARVLGPAAPVRYVFFDAEEPFPAAVGAEHRNFAFGSQAFVDRAPAARVAFVLESIGITCDDCQQLPPGVPRGLFQVDGRAVYWVVDDPSPAPWADWIATAAAATPDRGVHGVGIPDRGASLGQARFSDHAPFWDAGVPAVMVTDTALLRNANYHQRGDTADHIDPAFVGDTVRGVAAAVRAAAGLCTAGATE